MTMSHPLRALSLKWFSESSKVHSIARPDLPFALQVEITSHCNLHCKMCPLTVEGTSSSLTPGNVQEVSWREVVKIAREIRNVIIAGFGEPLLHPDCLRMLQELDRNGVWTSFATNGTAITRATAVRLAALRNLMHINVSIDSPDPEIYRAIRGGELERALQGLRNLMAAINDCNRVTVSSVAMSSNLASLAQFPPLLASLGVKRFVLQNLAQFSADCARERLLDPSAIGEAIEGLRRACKEASVELVSLYRPAGLEVRRRSSRNLRRRNWRQRSPRWRQALRTPLGDAFRRQGRSGLPLLLCVHAIERAPRRLADNTVGGGLAGRALPALPRRHSRGRHDAGSLPQLHDRATRNASHAILRRRAAVGAIGSLRVRPGPVGAQHRHARLDGGGRHPHRYRQSARPRLAVGDRRLVRHQSGHDLQRGSRSSRSR